MRRVLLVAALMVAGLPGSAAGSSGAIRRLDGPRTGSVSFYARVVCAGARGLTLRLEDGRKVSFSAAQVTVLGPPARSHAVVAHMAAADPAVQSLDPGITVLVIERVGLSGRPAVTIALPPASPPGAGGEQQATGVVTAADPGVLTLATAGGLALRLHAAPNAVAALQVTVGERIEVIYHQDGGALIVEAVRGAASGYRS